MLDDGWRDSLYAGALLPQTGELSFVLAEVGLQPQILNEYGYQLAIAVIAISLLLSPARIAGIKKLVTR